jgi:hypothetical protein
MSSSSGIIIESRLDRDHLGQTASAHPPAPCAAVARARDHARPEGEVLAELMGVVRVHSKVYVVPHVVVPP